MSIKNRKGVFLPYDPKLERKLTLREKNIMGNFLVYKLFKRVKSGEKEFIKVPRMFEPKRHEKKIKVLNKKKDHHINIKLSNNQEVVLRQVFDLFKDEVYRGGASCVLQLEPGKGKTFIALSAINKLSLHTLIVVHNTNMLMQWKEKLISSGCDPGVFYSNEKNIKPVTIAIIHTLVKQDQTFFKNFDFCVLDECHLFLSEVWRSFLFKHVFPYTLGLTATPPDSHEIKRKIMNFFLGPIIVGENLEGYENETTEFKGQIIKLNYRGTPQNTLPIINEKTGKIDFSRLLSNVLQDPYRINLVALWAKQLYEEGFDTYIFSDRIQHLAEIKEKIIEYVDPSHISMVTGGDKDVFHKIEGKKIILTTYQFMGTGVSVNRMNASILASPRKKNCKQYIDRIFRLGSDQNVVRKIVDIVDSKTCLKTQWYARKKEYDKKKYEIEEIKQSFSDFL